MQSITNSSIAVLMVLYFIYFAGEARLETAGATQLHGHPMAHHILSVLCRHGESFFYLPFGL